LEETPRRNNLIASGPVEYNCERYNNTAAVEEQFLMEKLGIQRAHCHIGHMTRPVLHNHALQIFIRNDNFHIIVRKGQYLKLHY
jgi:hypothetical protein